MGTLVALAGFAFFWIFYPPIRGDGLYEESVQKVQLILEERRSIVFDEESNLLRHEEFQKFWGLRELEYEEGAELELIVLNWNRHCSPREYDSALSTEELLETQDPEILKAKSDFKELLPELKVVLHRPKYAYLIDDFDDETKVPNYKSLKELCLALCSYAEYAKAEGQDGEALECLYLGFHIARLVGENEGSLPNTISLRLTKSVFETFIGTMKPQDLAQPDFLEHLRNEVPAADGLVTALQVDLVWQLRAWTKDSAGESVTAAAALNRDGRILANIYLEAIDAAKRGDRKGLEGLIHPFTLPNIFLGRASGAAELFMTDPAQTAAQFYLRRKMMMGLVLACELLVQKQENGVYPTALESELSGIEEWQLKEAGESRELSVVLLPGEAELFDSRTDWVRLDGNRLTFYLP